MMTENTPQQHYNSLLAIRARKMELQKQLNEQENKIHRLWHGLFHEEKATCPRLLHSASWLWLQREWAS